MKSTFTLSALFMVFLLLTSLFEASAAAPTIACPGTKSNFVNPTSGLIDAFPFNETSGTTAYDVIGNLNATLENTTSWDATGKYGAAVSLNGSANYVTLPKGIVSTLSSDYTISVWVYWRGTNAWERVFDIGNSSATGYMYLTASDGSAVQFAITNSGNWADQKLTGSAKLTQNAWSHVVITLSGNTGTMFVNGASVATNGSMTIKPSSLGSTTANYIGKSQFSDPNLNGKVDELRFYNRALTAGEVTALYNASASTAGADYGTGLGAPTITDNGCGNSKGQSNAWGTQLPLGINTVTWTASGDCGQTNTCTQSVTAIQGTPTFTGTLATQSTLNTTYTLTGGLPAGGTYSGTSVTGTNFNASTAGVGTHTITYSYTYTYADGTSATKTATNTITVNSSTITIPGTGNTAASTLATGPYYDLVIPLGGTLTVDQATTVRNITVGPGGKLDLSNTLTVGGNVTLMDDATGSFSVNLGNTGIAVSGTVRYVKTMNNTRWYFVSFPCDVTVGAITKSNGNSLGTLGVDWFIKYYDGNSRTSNLGTTSNWKSISAQADPSKLMAYKGYIIGINDGLGPFDFLFPLTINPTDMYRNCLCSVIN